MARVADADLRRVLGFLEQAAAVETDDAFPPELLVGLQQLVPCDWVSFSELDRVRERVLGGSVSFCEFDQVREQVLDGKSSPGSEAEEPAVSYWSIRDEHPVCRHQVVAGDWHAHTLTDFVTRRQLRRGRIYSLWFRPLGIEHELCVGLDSPLSHSKVFIFDRGDGRDFDERDKNVLDLLRPHLARLYRAAADRRRLRAALATLEHTDSALVLLDEDDRPSHLTKRAQELLARYCDSRGSHLPAPVLSWLADTRTQTQPDTLTVHGKDGTLTLRRTSNALLLDEHPHTPTLTSRQQQILELVAQGLTNAQIAHALWLAPGTVRRHLENIYKTLHVHNRTAAAAHLPSPNTAQAHTPHPRQRHR